MSGTFHRPVDAKEVLEALRAESAQEYGIRGIEAIGAWFHKVGYANKPVTRRTLFRWKAEDNCPFGSPRPGHNSWTTNLLLMAWAATRVRKRAAKKLGRRQRAREKKLIADREMVAEAIRKKLIQGGAPVREDQGTAPAPSRPA